MQHPKTAFILAIETSCDETSFALLENNHLVAVVTASQIKQHQDYGGVVPELASRLHFEQFDYLLHRLQTETNFQWSQITHIAYTAKPGLVGCLKIGQVMAQSLSCALQKPLLPVNHLSGHLYANFFDHPPSHWPFLGLIVSGGHSEIWKYTSHNDYEIVASCLDDAAGECFDKLGRLCGLAYPAGAAIEQLAESGQLIFDLMQLQLQPEANFSFSGLKSAFAHYWQTHQPNRADFCATLQAKVIAVIGAKMQLALKQHDDVKLFVAGGGVLANRSLQQALAALAQQRSIIFQAPHQAYCTDNAAMIGAYAYYHLQKARNYGLF